MWEDEDDERVEVNIAGRSRLRKLRQAEDEAILRGQPALAVQHETLTCC